MHFTLESTISEETMGKIVEREHVREFSNDLAKFVYIAAWFFFGIRNIFTSDMDIYSAQTFYYQFDIPALLYLFLSGKVSLVEKEGFLRIPSEHKKAAFYANTFGILEGCALLAIFIIVWEAFSRGRIGSTESEIVFQLTRSIPTEEMVFRGLGSTVIIIMFIYIFQLNKNLDDSQYIWRYRIMWTLTTIAIGILFGLYHITKYYDPALYPYFAENINGVDVLTPLYVPIVYLCLLGIVLGIVYYRHGLFCAMVVHVLNNLLAIASLGFYYYFALIF